MSAIPDTLRPAAVLGAILLAGFSGLARAQDVATAEPTRTTLEQEPSAPAPAVVSPVVVNETGSTEAPAVQPAAVEPAPLPDTLGPPPESDFKDVPQSKDEPAIAMPETVQKPSEPVAAAIFARLDDAKPLLARLPAKQREALKAFYAAGTFKPIWIADHAFNPAAQAVMTRLRAAAEDGLDPKAYPVPLLPAKPEGQPDAAQAAAIADADLMLSAAALLYARDARGGRVNLSAISRLVTPTLDLPSAEILLPQLASAGAGAADTLRAYNPQTFGYQALRKRLATLRGKPAQTALPILRLSSSGPVLGVGMFDPRVPDLRRHFSLPAKAAGDADIYDTDVADAVEAFQRDRGLPANGRLTRATIVALATGPRAVSTRDVDGAEADILVNMERWRWLPGDLGSDYVLVNVPEFRLRVVRDGSLRDETRVITGKAESPTPLFSGEMEYAVVNPSWFVPPSILKTMLASGKTGGFEVVRRNGQVSLRQPPGERNALGFIKFMFPNQHAVYLHDTPNRSLFAGSVRALSHGCVRVDDPFRFAGTVLPTEWTSERLKKLIGKGERTIRLSKKLPVHLAYFTAYLDDDGVYRTLPDIYGYDAKMKAALGLSTQPGAMAQRPAEPKRQVADMPSSGTAAPRRQAARPTQRRQATYGDPYGYGYTYRQPVEADYFDRQAAQPLSRGWW